MKTLEQTEDNLEPARKTFARKYWARSSSNLLNRWSWSSNGYIIPNSEVAAWAFVPEETDPNWIRDKTPEESGYNNTILGGLVSAREFLILYRVKDVVDTGLFFGSAVRIWNDEDKKMEWQMQNERIVEAWMPMPRKYPMRRPKPNFYSERMG